MSELTLPRDRTAILVMDCQNDVVHEDGKVGGQLTGRVKEKNILGTISKLAAAGRAANVPIIHVRHAYRSDYADLPQNIKFFRGMKKCRRCKTALGELRYTQT
jgi:nicotinamidase-related amidase